MTDHSPARWFVDEYGAIRAADYTIVAHCKSGDVHTANTNVMAAAPQMLDALKGIIVYDDETHFLAAHRRNEILKIIAKAEPTNV